MKVFKEIGIDEFDAWSGAKITQEKIIAQNLQHEFENLIEELFPDGIDETTLNDVLWFEDDYLREAIGLKDEDEDEDEEI